MASMFPPVQEKSLSRPLPLNASQEYERVTSARLRKGGGGILYPIPQAAME